jgi:hypothetical protein
MVVAPGNRHAGSSRGRLATARTDSGEVDIALKEGWMGGGETPHTEVAERMVGGAETWQRPDDHDHIVSVVDYGSGPLACPGPGWSTRTVAISMTAPVTYRSSSRLKASMG